MYNALDIARYVINYSNSKGIAISNLKLQKVLYFIQGNFYKIKNDYCFIEDIHAWNYGPVVPEIYRKFKGFGSNNIPFVKTVYKFNENNGFETENYNDDFLNKDDKELINNIIDMCANYSANQLVSLTHQQKPWKETYRRNRDYIIDRKMIGDFFKNG